MFYALWRRIKHERDGIGADAAQGFFGFLISVAAILSIKVTSPVTHSESIRS